MLLQKNCWGKLLTLLSAAYKLCFQVTSNWNVENIRNIPYLICGHRRHSNFNYQVCATTSPCWIVLPPPSAPEIETFHAFAAWDFRLTHRDPASTMMFINDIEKITPVLNWVTFSHEISMQKMENASWDQVHSVTGLYERRYPLMMLVP